jgi:hypothetical protein
MKLSRRLPFLCLALILPAPGFSALVVDWGGNYVSGDVQMQEGGFVDGDPLVLSPATSYTGTSARFHGAVAITGTRTRATIVQNNGSNDRLQLKSSDAGGGVASYLFLWDKGDFLNGMNSESAGFSSTDTITISLATYAQFSPGRIVIQQGSSYYVSEAVFNAATSFTVNPTGLDWFNYDPTGWSATNAATLSTIGSAASPVFGGMLSNITEVGFLFTSNDSSSNAVRVQNFEVTMSVIPEPTAAVLCAGGLLFLLPRRKKA